VIALVGTLCLSLLVLAPAGAAPPPPQIASFAPTQGPVATSVTISGSGFNSTTSVTFNGVEASFSQNTASAIVAGVPAGATSGGITVTTRHGSSTSAGSFTVSQQKPNIVLILTDDQRYDELSGMPIVNSELIDKGLSFTNGFVEDPLCCPSRATILTGRESNSTDVYDNKPPHGGYTTFHTEGEESSTIATWLHGAGYYTGLVGKYFNGYTPTRAVSVPPGWDVWDGVANGSGPDGPGGGMYYQYYVSENGTLRYYGNDPSDYSTDVLAGYATRFITNAPSNKPLFLYFAPRAPHLRARPAPSDRNAFPDLAPLRPPSANEADVSDKPQYIQAIPPLTPTQMTARDDARRSQFRSLLSVDRAVGGILDALRNTGRLGTTFILFASDNGLNIAEHRWTEKRVPYEESIRVPIIVRYDPATGLTARTDPHFVLNLDFAQTFANLADTAAPGAQGASILPLLAGDANGWRNDFLIEHWENHVQVPAYCAVRNQQYLYVEYQTGEQELYDLTTDPYELTNLASDPTRATALSTLHSRMVQLCSPPPPGFTP
jgi:arylsulfatase A-like enzyme